MAVQPYEVFLNGFVIGLGIGVVILGILYAVSFVHFWVQEWRKR